VIRKGSRVVALSTVYGPGRRPVPKGCVGKVNLFFHKVDETYVGVYVKVERVARVTFNVPGTGNVVTEINARALQPAPKVRSRQ
jgi:hypothetical protein